MRTECIEAVVKAIGRSITQAEAKQIEQRITDSMRQVARSDPAAWRQMTQRERLTAAAEFAGKDLLHEATNKRQRVALTILAHSNIEGRYLDLTASGRKPFDAVKIILKQGDARTKGVANEYFSDLVDTIQAVEPRFFGLVEDAKVAGEFVREIFTPGSTGNAVLRKAAQTWLETVEAMRMRFNSLGGDVGKLDYGYIPQPHDAVRLIKAGAEKWSSDILPLLDRSRYLHEDGSLLSDPESAAMLTHAYETISTNGLNKIEPGKVSGTGMLANRHSDARVLHFRDAGAWLQYHAEYGKGSVFSAMQGHVSALSRDIALAEEFGPNPAVQASWLYDTAKKTGASDRFGIANSMWKVLSGEANHPVDVKFAEVMQGARNLVSHAKLGFALISSINDFPSYFLTTGFNRIRHSDALMGFLRTFDGETKEYANRAGLVVNSLISDMNRFAEGNLGQGWTGTLANGTMKASLLEGWTNAIRRALSITMMGAYGKLSRGEWAALDAGDRWRMEAKGITETDFKVWKLAQPENWKGSAMLTKDSLRAISEADLQAAGLSNMDRNRALSRLLGAIADESEFASLGQDLETRAITTMGLQKGTLGGELVRSSMLFKGFSIAMISRHFGRVADQWRNGEHASAVAYSAGLITSMTILGAISLQLKDILNGKDPRNMDPTEGQHGGKFWIAAAAQGGGMGIAGDLLYQAMGGQKSQSGVPTSVGVLSMLAGPVVGSVIDLGDVTLGNIGRAAGGHETHAGADAMRWARSNLPLAGFTNLWYAKAAIDHAVLNDMQEYLSPGYLSRMQERAGKDWGQQFYWSPRDGAPARGPDMDKAFGR